MYAAILVEAPDINGTIHPNQILLIDLNINNAPYYGDGDPSFYLKNSKVIRFDCSSSSLFDFSLFGISLPLELASNPTIGGSVRALFGHPTHDDGWPVYSHQFSVTATIVALWGTCFTPKNCHILFYKYSRKWKRFRYNIKRKCYHLNGSCNPKIIGITHGSFSTAQYV